jgi:glycosyltransferase involved in cell wall biosynthesis
MINRERIAVIFSSGPPWTTHLVARHLRKKYGIPWVADFRDPWAAAQIHRPRWASRLNYSMEAVCVQAADLVVCNTEALRQNFVARYPALPGSRFVVLTGGFDDSITPPAVPKASRRILLHLGDIYQSRRIDTFCEAVQSLIDSRKIEPNSLQVRFVGEIDLTLKLAVGRLLSELTAAKLIELIPRMNWQAGQRLLRGADLLLLFQGDFKTQVPAKFYEYLQTGKPIFAVAAKGALTELLDSTGSGVWADPADACGIAAGLLRALELPAIPPEEVARRWNGQFHYRSLTAQLAGWISQLAARRSPGPLCL